jgi:hypothetical protein
MALAPRTVWNMPDCRVHPDGTGAAILPGLPIAESGGTDNVFCAAEPKACRVFHIPRAGSFGGEFAHPTHGYREGQMIY